MKTFFTGLFILFTLSNTSPILAADNEDFCESYRKSTYYDSNILLARLAFHFGMSYPDNVISSQFFRVGRCINLTAFSKERDTYGRRTARAIVHAW